MESLKKIKPSSLDNTNNMLAQLGIDLSRSEYSANREVQKVLFLKNWPLRRVGVLDPHLK